jgi:hypothetical protein
MSKKLYVDFFSSLLHSIFHNLPQKISKYVLKNWYSEFDWLSIAAQWQTLTNIMNHQVPGKAGNF